MRTLVIHSGGIGDFLLACPAIARLGEDGPIEVAGISERAALAVAGGIAEAAHDLDAIDFHTAYTQPSVRLTTFLQRFDRAVVWLRDDGALDRTLRHGGIRDVCIFAGLPPDDWTEHASRYYLSCLGYPPVVSWRLHIAPSVARHDILIHPGSGGAHKNWPLENYAQLSERLLAAGRRVTWIRGPAEEEFSLPLNSAMLTTSSLIDVAQALAATTLYIGNDSGITHLAAAVGCPTIALFGPTDPAIWAPLGEHVRVLRGNPWVSVGDVVTEAEKS